MLKVQEYLGNEKVKFMNINLNISGDGSSIWGESKGTFKINKLYIACFDFTYGCGIIELSGPKTKEFHYTDKLIKKEVNEKIKPILNKYFGKEIPNMRIVWSEQGMQPENGWNFDVMFTKDNHENN